MSKPMPCFRCDSPTEAAMPGTVNQPYAATAFMTQGHYGSTVFDPMDGTWLEINICDDCLKAHSEKVLHFLRPKKAIKWEAP